MSDVVRIKAEAEHEFIHDLRNIPYIEVSVKGWSFEIAVSWQARNDHISRERILVVLRAELRHDAQELQEGARPALQQQQGHGVRVFAV